MIPEPDALDEVGNFVMAELENLPLADLERPAFLAKNRYDLPDTLPLEWSAFAQAMPETLHPTLIPSTTTRT